MSIYWKRMALIVVIVLLLLSTAEVLDAEISKSATIQSTGYPSHSIKSGHRQSYENNTFSLEYTGYEEYSYFTKHPLKAKISYNNKSIQIETTTTIDYITKKEIKHLSFNSIESSKIFERIGTFSRTIYNSTIACDVYRSQNGSIISTLNNSYYLLERYKADGFFWTEFRITRESLNKLYLNLTSVDGLEEWEPPKPWYKEERTINESRYLRKYHDIAQRLGDFERFTIGKEVYLRSPEGKEFLVDEKILSDIAEYIRGKFKNKTDRLIAAMMFVTQFSLVAHPMSPLDYQHTDDEAGAVKIIRKGYGMCSQMACVLAHLLYRMGFEDVYYYGVENVHTLLLVDYGKGKVPLDPYYGMFYLNQEGELASLEEIKKNPELAKSQYYDFSYLFKTDAIVIKIMFEDMYPPYHIAFLFGLWIAFSVLSLIFVTYILQRSRGGRGALYCSISIGTMVLLSWLLFYPLQVLTYPRLIYFVLDITTASLLSVLAGIALWILLISKYS